VLNLARQHGVLRPRDLATHGIAREHLRRLEQRGLLDRVGRGLYILPGAPVTSEHSFAAAAKRVPNGVICLLSALRFHHLTTQAPFEVWLAIDPKAHRPRVNDPPLRIVRFSGPALHEGVERRLIDGVLVSVFSPAKTVADLFKHRNKIGLDVALEALRDVWGERRATMDDLWRYAQICRVATVMRPYLEALV
jgi:predicted transcriptional regulator of viral defense system